MQRYTFWSNSQRNNFSSDSGGVVRANAKIHILKQFTTKTKRNLLNGELYVLMQRYTFWSNSQLVVVLVLDIVVVRANAKIHILKQFTTIGLNQFSDFKLYVLMQRYTFWSNSQLAWTLLEDVCVVRANAKIHILKQFTTSSLKRRTIGSCTC